LKPLALGLGFENRCLGLEGPVPDLGLDLEVLLLDLETPGIARYIQV